MLRSSAWKLLGRKSGSISLVPTLQHRHGRAYSWLRPYSHHQSDSHSGRFWMVFLAITASSINVAVAEGDSSTPYIRRSEVAAHKTKDTGIWVLYKDGVYDVTSFVTNHPGGKDKIMLAAGDDIEPYWNVYRQHYNSPLPRELLINMRIGTLHPDDLAALDAERSKSQRSADDPYARDPALSPLLKHYSRQPLNAEPPGSLLTDAWLTPSDLWFVRNHHPVYHVREQDYRLEVVFASDLLGGEHHPSSTFDKHESPPLLSLDLHRLKTEYAHSSIVSSIQCAGNRRALMTAKEKTNGSSWDISAIANAQWGGARLRDILQSLGVTEETVFGEHSQPPFSKIRHVHVVSGDGMEVSVPIKKALSRWGDVLLAYEMNQAAIDPVHGYPIRFIVPGHVGVRNVKWVTKIRLSGEEAHGPWQRGMAYKGLSPAWKTLDGIDVEAIPSLQELPVQSVITVPSPNSKLPVDEPLTVKGYAYSGGGRGIMRVDVSADGGKTWHTARLADGSQQPMDQAWAWTFWEADLPVGSHEPGSQLQLVCKATDVSYNVQPESIDGIWNLRGINNNSWHRVNIELVPAEPEDEDE